MEKCGDYLMILVLHGTFVSHGCLVKTYVIVALINWAVLETKRILNLMQYCVCYKNR